MCRIWITVIATLIGLSGPASVAGTGLFSATGKVIAILDDDLFMGEAEGHLNGAGSFVIRSQTNPDVNCFGHFTSSALLGGSGEMRCSDGAVATFHFQRLSVFRGYGVGKFSRGSMSFTYGMTVGEAMRYLKLPEGKKLMHRGAEPELVDIAESTPKVRQRTD